MAERRKSLSILGLPPGASEDDIRKAYKKLALQYHPDKNESDDAKGKFQEISNAYKILTEGPGDFDGGHGAHGHDLRAEFLRRMFEEMFFPSFAFRGPRGFPFVFVDSDSDDECYYFDDDDSSDDNDYMFNSSGHGHRQFQNRYPGPTGPAQTQHEPSKKQQRKKEKRRRQKERAKEKKAQERSGNSKQWTSQDYFQNQSPDQKKSEPQSKEPDQKSNQSDEKKESAESQTKDNQSRKTDDSSQNQPKENNQSEKQSETGSGSQRSETPNLSRPATPLETQPNPQKLTKKQRKKMESEQRKREQEMAEIAAELLRKQEREKEKQREKERKAEQKDSEEKENEGNIGWSPYDTKKMSRKARQRARRRQEAMPAGNAESRQDTSDSDDDDDNDSCSDGKEAHTGKTGDRCSDGAPREPFENVQQGNTAKFNNTNPTKQPGNTYNNMTASTKSKQSKIIRNSHGNNAGTQQKTTNKGNQHQNTNNRNVAGSQRNRDDPRYGVNTAPNRYNVLDDFEDVITTTKKPFVNDFQFMSSDSEVEDIISGHSKSQPHYQNKGNNSRPGFKASAMGNNQSVNQPKGSKQDLFGSKGNNQNKNYSAGPKPKIVDKKRQNQSSFSARGGRGASITQQRGGKSDMTCGGGRGANLSQPRGSSSDMSYGDFDNGRFPEGPHRENNEFNRAPYREFNDFRGAYQREFHDFNGFHDRRGQEFCPKNFGPRVRHEKPFDPHLHDWAYGMDEPRPRNYGPPPYHGGPHFPANFNNGPFPPHGYGPQGGFEPPFHPVGGPFNFQRDSFRGKPPGFKTGPPRGRTRGKGGRPYIDPHRGSTNDEDLNGFHGNKPNFSAGNFQPGATPHVPYGKTGDNYQKDLRTGTESNRDRMSSMSGANSPALSSSSGVSLDSLDEFSSSQGYRPKYSDNIQSRNDSGRKSPMYHGGLGYDGLVGMDALGVPKGFLGDRVRNYYS